MSQAAFADRAWHGTALVEENSAIARDTYRLRLCCPPIARAIVPGQFLMVRLPGTDDPLLGRPLAIYDTTGGSPGEPQAIEVVYLALGKMTRRLATVAIGSPLEMWGPLGNGFGVAEAPHLVMVAGGIGYTPFMALAAERLGRRRYGDPARSAPASARATLCFGVRSADYLPRLDDFRRLGVAIHASSDDGSIGHHGYVTDLLDGTLAASDLPCRVVACGPEPMMARAAEIAERHGAPCEVSLESPMACGIGACFSCVVKVRTADGGWDYRRSCVEGPVFDARLIRFD